MRWLRRWLIRAAGDDEFEGRWCPHPGCRGMLKHGRSFRGGSLQTWLICCLCGWRRLIWDEPDFRGRGTGDAVPISSEDGGFRPR